MTLMDIRDLLQRAGGKSDISGVVTTDATISLTIIRADPSKPLSVSNALVVTTKEAILGLRRLGFSDIHKCLKKTSETST